MALSAPLTKEQLDRLAPSLSESLARFLPASSGPEVGEAFEVWKLGVVDQRGGRLDDLAVPTGRYYLQIYASHGEQEGVPAAVASISGIESEEPRIHGLFDKQLATDINHAIDVVDNTDGVPDDIVPRLLIASPYRVRAMWFPRHPEPDAIFVISAVRGLKNITRGQWMPADRFIAALAHEDVVSGVVDDPPVR
jgi:hypothetical protein